MSEQNSDHWALATRAIRVGHQRTPEGEHGEPIFPTSSFVFANAAEAAARSKAARASSRRPPSTSRAPLSSQPSSSAVRYSLSASCGSCSATACSAATMASITGASAIVTGVLGGLALSARSDHCCNRARSDSINSTIQSTSS